MCRSALQDAVDDIAHVGGQRRRRFDGRQRRARLVGLAEPVRGDTRAEMDERVAWRAEDEVVEAARRLLAAPPAGPAFAKYPTAAATALALDAEEWSGIGWGQGRAVVINCECELSRVAPGDILVTRVAGPALSHILPRVGGVVAELGGSTSHLASLARERGIPMVLGVLDATQHIPDGSQVGTLGGGCVEAEVKRRALQLLDHGRPELLTFQLDSDYGWDDGLICGGRMIALIDPVSQETADSYYLKYATLVESGLGCTEVVPFKEHSPPDPVSRYLFDAQGELVAQVGAPPPGPEVLEHHGHRVGALPVTPLALEHRGDVGQVLRGEGTLPLRVVVQEEHRGRRVQLLLREVLGGGEHPEIFIVTIDPDRNPYADYLRGTFDWHIDGCTDDIPIMATMLCAHGVAEEGGETEFANGVAALVFVGDAMEEDVDALCHAAGELGLRGTPARPQSPPACGPARSDR